MTIKSSLRDERGSALIVVLMIMVVLMILGVVFMNTSVAENKFAAKNEDRLQAYYLARTGALAMTEYIIQGEMDVDKIINITSKPNKQIGGGSFTVTVEKVIDTNNYDVISVGEFNGVTQTAKILITTTGSGIGGIFDHALTAVGEIGGGTGIVITGSVSSKNGSIKLTSNQVTGDIVIDDSLNFPAILKPDPSKFDVNDKYGTITDGLSIASVKDKPRYVDIQSINLKNDKIIKITGDGSVHMFVNGDILVGNKAGFDIAQSAKLYIYVIGERNVQLSKGAGNDLINFMLYAPKSTVSFHNADKNSIFYGIIIAKTIELTNHLQISYNSDMISELKDLNLDTTNLGVKYTGYSWFE